MPRRNSPPEFDLEAVRQVPGALGLAFGDEHLLQLEDAALRFMLLREIAGDATKGQIRTQLNAVAEAGNRLVEALGKLDTSSVALLTGELRKLSPPVRVPVLQRALFETQLAAKRAEDSLGEGTALLSTEDLLLGFIAELGGIYTCATGRPPGYGQRKKDVHAVRDTVTRDVEYKGPFVSFVGGVFGALGLDYSNLYVGKLVKASRQRAAKKPTSAKRGRQG